MKRFLLGGLLLAILAGCNGTQTDSPEKSQPLSEAAKKYRPVFLVTEQPAGAITVVEAMGKLAPPAEGEAAAPETPAAEPTLMVVEGQIGGMPNPFGEDAGAEFPWYAEMAAFSLVDPATAVEFEGHEHAEGEECLWCTRTAQKMVDTVATVELNDESGEIIAEQADTLLGLEEGTTVVVEGTARMELGRLKIVADHIYVKL
ncbi:OB-fold nucleic acid binding domain-containing protein [Aeoliella mucimassa]|uniref:Lipoprotein n=1 Tax=Aeoliella mucimassa TaxID=2527972 RepID=A0A518AVW1_9BACT|nr:hypothetical protein [Aeoliella mucimassa]QDU58831.1 hypothetical protein Pan181_50710 [Aeoliella mucimassa]